MLIDIKIRNLFMINNNNNIWHMTHRNAFYDCNHNFVTNNLLTYGFYRN